jgi:hypothetical protein
MNIKLARKIVEVAEETGDVGSVSLLEEYSGRGMYGDVTAAVVGITPLLLAELLLSNAHRFTEDGQPMFPGETVFSDSLDYDTVLY